MRFKIGDRIVLFDGSGMEYHAVIDQVAKKRRVFKVETVGDCYVAVCGLPEPRKDHAVIMARFARDCMQTMGKLTSDLEVALGPETGGTYLNLGSRYYCSTLSI